MKDKESVGEKEYVLLDLDGVSGHLDIPHNAAYVLSGMDTLNPVLIIADKIKLIGRYEETVGTCLVLSVDDSTQEKRLKPITQLHKILKFRAVGDASSVEGH